MLYCYTRSIQVALYLLNRDQKVLLAYPQQAPGAHNQQSRLSLLPVDVDILYGPHLLVVGVIYVEPTKVLPRLFEI